MVFGVRADVGNVKISDKNYTMVPRKYENRNGDINECRGFSVNGEVRINALYLLNR